jgi:foldase protein PrsA
MTRTRAKAAEARAALESGRSWASVVKQYSVDELTKNQGGKLEGVARGQQERPVDKAIFGATKGDLIGPIKTEFGWYVIKVTKITKASQQSLEQASATIKAILASENQQKALEAFIKDFQEQWKEKTTCREGYVIQDCKNAPKPKTTATTGARTEGDQD